MGRVQGALRRNGQERVGHGLVMWLGSSLWLLMLVHLSEEDTAGQKRRFSFLGVMAHKPTSHSLAWLASAKRAPISTSVLCSVSRIWAESAGCTCHSPRGDAQLGQTREVSSLIIDSR